MEAYPLDYTAHNLPLVVLSGLCPAPEETDDLVSSRGPLVKAQLPLVQSERREQILQEFLSAEGSDEQWSNRPTRARNGQTQLVGYKFRAVGREFRLPPRKAEPPSPQDLQRENPYEVSEGPKPSTQWTLHSPLSPLSPGSTLYPDGVFSPLWVEKHQKHIPCLLIAFFDFTSDANLNSLNDNQLKSEINGLRNALNQSEYKTRFAVALLSDKTILEAPDIEDRLSTIRRATGLDMKSGLFFLPPNTSRIEVSAFVTGILTALQPQCIEYYRDLTKHSRRKKNRGNPPPPTIPPTRTTSQPLSNHGWGIRYDVKLGVFAEFRQEMEAACRHYTSALESLLGPDGTLETTASWSPRWDEARLLADMMAFRIIRCLLWSHLSTTATQSWINYRDRMRELVDRRGRGAANYGWEAWESRWAKLMAELIQRADIPALSITDSIDMTVSTIPSTKPDNTTFLPPEKAIPVGERLPPWNHLHHPGYWLRLSARSAKRRRRFAQEIPEEDRAPPGRSPASAVAHRQHTYDLYMCPEPHVEFPIPPAQGFSHEADIIERLGSAARSFNERNQNRFADRLRLEIAREYLRKGESDEAVKLLKALWQSSSWRKEKWWLPLFELTRTLSECAHSAGDITALVSTLFELHSPHLRFFKDMKLDLMNCGKGITTAGDEGIVKPVVTLSPDSVTSFLQSSFYFDSDERHVGEGIHAQIVVLSSAHPNTAPITFSRIRGRFKPDRYAFEILHTKSPEAVPETPGRALSRIRSITLTDLSESMDSDISDGGAVSFRTQTDLTFYPGRRSVLALCFDVKDPGELELDTLDLEIETDEFRLIYTVQPTQFSQPHMWIVQGALKDLREKRIGRETPWSIEIKPKPPKLNVSISNIGQAFYTDERVKLVFEIFNGEEEEVDATIEAHLLARGTQPQISWLEEGEGKGESSTADDETAGALQSLRIPTLSPNQSRTRTCLFLAPSSPNNFIIEAKLNYRLPSDPQMPLSMTHTSALDITSPFEANYDFAPQVHPDPWPSFFVVGRPVPGLLQRWCLTASIASFASELLRIQNVHVVFENDSDSISCTVVEPMDKQVEVHVSPRKKRNYRFIIDSTLPSTKEQRAISLQAKLNITWSREGENSSTITSTILVPPLPLPPLEPRVIATAKHTQVVASPSLPSSTIEALQSPSMEHNTAGTPLTVLSLYLENPTPHPLTFDITVPSSESLAFSGPKQQAATLLPYSRTDIKFRLLPLVKSGTWVVFGIKVKDRYYVRDVGVLAGEGVITADEGGVRWQVE